MSLIPIGGNLVDNFFYLLMIRYSLGIISLCPVHIPRLTHTYPHSGEFHPQAVPTPSGQPHA